MILNIAELIVCLGGIIATIQNYSRWKKYCNKEDLWWTVGGILAIFVALFFFASDKWG